VEREDGFESSIGTEGGFVISDERQRAISVVDRELNRSLSEVYLKGLTEFQRRIVSEDVTKIHSRLLAVLEYIPEERHEEALESEGLINLIQDSIQLISEKLILQTKQSTVDEFAREIASGRRDISTLESTNDKLSRRIAEKEILLDEQQEVIDQLYHDYQVAIADALKDKQTIEDLKQKIQDNFYDKKTGLLLNDKAQDRARASLVTLLRDMRESPKAFGALFFDIDHFTQVNDLFGHPEADKVLQKVAEIIKGVVKRQTDFASRFGGEEMVIYLRYPNRAILEQMANQVLDEVRNTNFRLLPVGKKQKQDFQVTISVGGFMQHLDVHTCDDILKEHKQRLVEEGEEVPETIYMEDLVLSRILSESDRLMYKSKNEGRDRSNIATSQDSKIETGDTDNAILV
jgi:diguanylate cyclase (GGDEF)-like protein